MLTAVKIVNYLFFMNDFAVKASESYKKLMNLCKKFCEFPPWYLKDLMCSDFTCTSVP